MRSGGGARAWLGMANAVVVAVTAAPAGAQNGADGPRNEPETSTNTLSGEVPAPADPRRSDVRGPRPSKVIDGETDTATCRPLVIRNWRLEDGVPPGYRPQTAVNQKILWGGLGVFGAQYLYSAIFPNLVGAIIDGELDDGGLLWIPVGGAFAYGARRGNDDVAAWFAYTSGTIQVGGLLAAVYALAFRDTELVLDEDAADGGGVSAGSLSVVPWVSPGSVGIGARAPF
ncbi:MAG: hypothetical protein AAF715_32555 [Myxococcota bacterium]